MGILSKLFAKSEKRETTLTESPACPHTALVPRWDSIDDIGRDEKATHYVCEACGDSFSPEEALQLRASEARRLADITSANEN